MRTAAALAALIAVASSVPALAVAQEGRGHGKHDDRREARGPDRDDHRENRGRDERGPDRRADRGPERAIVDVRRELDRRERDVRREVARDRRDVERAVDRREDQLLRTWFEPATERRVINGCPPGLAWRDNGCLPPGQARRIARDRYERWWGGGDAYRQRYDNGYVYRVNNDGGLMGYLPVLAGALGMGQVWPSSYAYEAPPAYYGQYYGLGDRYDYRYADGVLYGVDPQTQSISQVAALLTGQDWTVGQAMPAGYDVYNVPYDYRSRYADGPDRLYRYSDGQIYQVDPTTRLVQAAIQLLT